MRRIWIIVFLVITGFVGFAQQKVYYAGFLEKAPKIDGKEDSVYSKLESATGFIQYLPDNGKSPSNKTVVKVGYTSRAVYVFAYLFQNPKTIHDYLTPRDDAGQSDWFGVFIDTYNSGQVAYAFIVTAAGVQVDKKIIGTTEDYQWNAVWKSAVRKTDYGWIVEMRIPFNHLRFPKKDEQVWAINFIRNYQKNRELDSWNYMDVKQNEFISQFGLIRGIKNIKYAPRIDLYPYMSYYLERQGQTQDWGRYWNGGVDLKLGLSRSFTLDMMLIPDFGEVMSDEPVLNLSPYETYYMERRQFFTEGTEIFNIGGVFYSKRIGGVPAKYDEIENILEPNEIILRNPLEVRILNGTKISGTNRKNLGIGILNALTANTYAEILDTVTGEVRNYLTDHQTNYNVFALKKGLKNSSYVGFINTNKYVLTGKFYMANVSAFESSLYDRSRKFRFFYRTAASAKFSQNLTKPTLGYMYQISFGKVSGNFKFSFNRSLYSDTYDPNDLGYLKVNNIVTNSATVGYYIYKPFWVVRKWTTRFSIQYQTLYRPFRYIGTEYKFEFYGTFKNLTSLGLRLNFTPDKMYDYFEPRVEDYVYIIPPKQNYMLWFSTDYSKKFAIDFQTGFYFPIEYKSQQSGGWVLFSPRLRMGDHLLLIYSIQASMDVNNYGFVGYTESRDSVFFGKRNVRTLENALNLELAFSPKSYLNMRVRHYWSLVNYFDYYALLRDGSLVSLQYPYRYVENQDKNFNSFNIDIIYTWQFLPGSELSIIYKKQLTSLQTELITDFWQNFSQFYNNTPALETFTIKIVFYI